MPYIGDSSGFDQEKVEELEGKVFDAIKGEDPSISAYVLLRTAVVLWVLGGVTREQALKVLTATADSYFKLRTH